jgi:hypothetical protein
MCIIYFHDLLMTKASSLFLLLGWNLISVASLVGMELNLNCLPYDTVFVMGFGGNDFGFLGHIRLGGYGPPSLKSLPHTQ